MPNDHQPNSTAIAAAMLRQAREYFLGVDEEPLLHRLHPIACERNDDHAPEADPA